MNSKERFEQLNNLGVSLHEDDAYTKILRNVSRCPLSVCVLPYYFNDGGTEHIYHVGSMENFKYMWRRDRNPEANRLFSYSNSEKMYEILVDEGVMAEGVEVAPVQVIGSIIADLHVLRIPGTGNYEFLLPCAAYLNGHVEAKK